MLLFDTAAPDAGFANAKATEIVAKLAAVEPPKRRRKTAKPLAERFWAKINKLPGADACWLWAASTRGSCEYGQFSVTDPVTGESRQMSPHRVAYELANNVKLPRGEIIKHSHKCISKLCCRPSHLRRGNQAENIQEAGRAGVLGKRKLTPDLAREAVARSRGDGGFEKQTLRAIAKALNVTPQNIQHVLHGRTWSKHTGIPASGKAALPKKPRAKVEKRSRPRKGPKHLEQGAVALAA